MDFEQVSGKHEIIFFGIKMIYLYIKKFYPWDILEYLC